MTEKLSNLSRVLFDKDAGDFFIGNDVDFDGEIVIEQYVQSEPSDTWLINLNVRGFFIQAFVFQNNGDGTLSLVVPKSVTPTDERQLRVEFGTPIIGVANILLGSDAQELILISPTPTPTPSVTATPFASPTVTPTVTPSVTPGASVTPTVSPTASVTPTVTVSPTVTQTPAFTSTPAPTPTLTVTPTPPTPFTIFVKWE